MNLFDIDNTILTACVDTETGEVINEELLDQLEMERDLKIENIGKWIKNLDSDIEALKAQKQIFADRQKAAENKKESLKKYLAAYLNGQKFEAKDKSVVISFRKSESVTILDELSIPMDYVKTELVSSIDKVAIKAAIKEGKEVTGAEITVNQNISIK